MGYDPLHEKDNPVTELSYLYEVVHKEEDSVNDLSLKDR